MKQNNAEEITAVGLKSFSVPNINKYDDSIDFRERMIKEIVKQDEEYFIKQRIRGNFTERYFNFSDEEIIDEIIRLGIEEYQRRQALGDTLNEK